MTKEDLTLLFDELNIPYREGIQYMEDNSNYPQIVFFDYRWEDVLSSGFKYDTVVSYQVSFRSMKPRDPKLIELKKLLNDKGKYPIISHEYIENKREWHSYFSVEVLEDVCAGLWSL